MADENVSRQNGDIEQRRNVVFGQRRWLRRQIFFVLLLPLADR